MIWLVVISSIIALGVIIGLVIHYKHLADSDSFGDSGLFGWIFAILAVIAFLIFRACRSGLI